MKAFVVGAGLSGLSAAWKLRQAGWQVKIIESSGRIGGRVQTVPHRGYLIDTGASAMTSAYTSYLALADEIGMGKDIVPASCTVAFARDGRIFEFDSRHIVRSGLATNLLSVRAKLGLARLFRDVFAARKQGLLDYNDLSKAAPLDTESAADYSLREFSREINDYFCDPIVRVMLLANGDKVSKVEFFSGIANIFDAEFCCVRGGQQRFADALGRGIDIELNARATEVRDCGDRVELTWENAGGTIGEIADACVVACHLPTACEICPDYRELLEPLNRSLSYTQAISVAIGTTKRPPTEAMIVNTPTCEDANIAALFLEHNKCADRAPTGHALFTAYWEAGASAQHWETPDEHLVAMTEAYVFRLFPELRGTTDMAHVVRWPRALPLTRIGAYQAIAKLNASLDPKARVQFAADYLSAAGQNTAVEFGSRAARNIAEHVKS